MAGDTKGAGHLLLALSKLLCFCYPLHIFLCLKLQTLSRDYLCLQSPVRDHTDIGSRQGAEAAEEHAQAQHMHSCESLVSSHFTQRALTLG